MSNTINAVIKQLRDEVQLLRDELAIMKRKYEDIIHNLDDENFSSRFVQEKNDMKTAIEVTAEGIKSQVSKEDLEGALEEYTTLQQTSNAITSHAYAKADLSSAVEVNDIKNATDKTKTYCIKDENNKRTYYYYNEISKRWEEIVGGGIETVFEQTATGYKLKGNIEIDGSCVLTDSLTFDSSDNPLQVQYSVDGTTDWHSTFNSDNDKFMRLKIGARWSDAMKVVGSDGQAGTNGTNATVTAEDVFNVLTAGGTTQGLFPVFYNGSNKLMINAEYIKSGTIDAERIDVDNLKVKRLYSEHSNENFYAKIASNVGDFGIYKSDAAANANPKNADCIWGLFYSDGLTGALNFFSNGDNFLGHNHKQGKTYPKGHWDFSSLTDISGLDARFG